MCCFVVVFVVNSLNLHIFVCARTLRFVVIRVVFIEAECHTSENVVADAPMHASDIDFQFPTTAVAAVPGMQGTMQRSIPFQARR